MGSRPRGRRARRDRRTVGTPRGAEEAGARAARRLPQADGPSAGPAVVAHHRRPAERHHVALQLSGAASPRAGAAGQGDPLFRSPLRPRHPLVPRPLSVQPPVAAPRHHDGCVALLSRASARGGARGAAPPAGEADRDAAEPDRARLLPLPTRGSRRAGDPHVRAGARPRGRAAGGRRGAPPARAGLLQLQPPPLLLHPAGPLPRAASALDRGISPAPSSSCSRARRCSAIPRA